MIASSLAVLLWKIKKEISTPDEGALQLIFLTGGTLLLATGLLQLSLAQDDLGSLSWGEHDITYNDTQIAQAVVAILTYLEGSFGALVMVAAGIAAIIGAAFGQYRAALGCLVVAVGAFILRSFMSTFFNTETIEGTYLFG